MSLPSIYFISVFSGLVLFAVPQRLKALTGMFLSAITGAITTWWAWLAWKTGEFTLHTSFEFWGGPPGFRVDRLSAFFLVIVNLICFLGFLYSLGYLRPYQPRKSSVAMTVHVLCLLLLQVSMQHVLMLREGTAFLMAWELMSATSFVLVIFEGEHASTLRTGIQYLIQMHVGFVLILIAFLLAYASTGIFGWEGFSQSLSHPGFPWILLLAGVGFGIKAGFVPLHTWLPHAHPAAPTHVSAIMSGVMIKMGLYGILRMIAGVQFHFDVIGYTLLGLSAVTGLTGILNSVFQRDLKRILAYSSIENIGLIGMGIGLALLGRAYNNEMFLQLGWAAALLHIVNHALYKPLLFFGAGNVYYASHTRNLDRLGGLIPKLPFTALFFLIGSIAISGIPPLNGFISEFMLYKAVFLSLASGTFYPSLLSLSVALVLTIIGGLAVFSFTRAFGVTFLGSRRTSSTRINPLPAIMAVPALVIIPIMIFIALSPTTFIRQIHLINNIFPYLAFPQSQPAVTEFSSPSLISLVLLLLIGTILLLRWLLATGRRKATSPTWGCGYTAGDFRHQYTATSYAENLKELASPALVRQVETRTFAEGEIFPDGGHYSSTTEDLIERRVIESPVENILSRLERFARAQTGKVHHYLIYPLVFMVLVVLISLLT
jgi:formate hydrogenlyase subunit 3/multisubunit Na+/H+ antiporter MnhD subunit